MIRVSSFLRRNQQGAALIEFALILPLLLLLVIGGFEVVRYMLVTQKVDKAVSSIANVVTQMFPANSCPNRADNISMERLRQIFHAGGGDGMLTHLLRPYQGRGNSGADQGNVFANISWNMSSVSNDGSGALAYNWSLNCRDVYGPDNCNNNNNLRAQLPAGFDPGAMRPGENALVINFFYQMPGIFRRWFNFNTDITQYSVRRTAIFVPRNGSLTTLPNTAQESRCPN